MLKGFKYRIYPNSEQEILCEKHFGCTRLVRNLALETKQMAYKGYKVNLSRFDLQAQLPDLKKEFKFLKEVNSQSLQSAIGDIDNAFKNFFKGYASFPKFKKKKDKKSFHCPQHTEINFEKNLLYLPKFSDPIQCEFHSRFKGKIKDVTIIKTPSGKYFASILVDTKEIAQPQRIINKETAIGIDLNLKDTVVLSDGTKFSNPKHLSLYEKKLKRLQHNFARMKMGSNRRERMRLRIARLHEKISNCRKDFLHKTSSAITKRDDTFCMEDLAVSNMMKNHKLAKAIADAGWGELVRQIAYKSEWQGKNVLFAGRFDASTKTCSCCGLINESITLADRSWICPFCFAGHDRDINAAVNIKQFALKKLLQAEHLLKNAEASPLRSELNPVEKRTDEALRFQDSIESLVLYC